MISAGPRGLPDLALYIHIPWCERKCPYCDFNSHVEMSGLPEQAYVECLIRDLQSQLHFVQSRQLTSIFIGGGTPSLFAAESIGAVLQAVQQYIPFSADIEITMEANPGSAEADKFTALLTAGVNRLSIGVQTFDDLCLQQLGRVHDCSNAIQAVNKAQKAGFKRINLDLMHGLPGQTSAMALDDLQQAIDLGVEHISWYQLTIEKNTEFYRYPPVLPNDDTLADIQDAGFDLLNQNGFKQYEISAFAKNTQCARHNINYWQFGDYLAIGAGAHGKLSLMDDDGLRIMRFNNTRNPKDYLQRTHDFIAKQQNIGAEDALFECLMNCLRLNQGMKTEDCLSYSGATLQQLMALCESAMDKKLLRIDKTIQATDLGRRYLNILLESLLDNS